METPRYKLGASLIFVLLALGVLFTPVLCRATIANAAPPRGPGIEFFVPCNARPVAAYNIPGGEETEILFISYHGGKGSPKQYTSPVEASFDESWLDENWNEPEGLLFWGFQDLPMKPGTYAQLFVWAKYPNGEEYHFNRVLYPCGAEIFLPLVVR